MENKNKIIAFMLSLLIIFSNILNVFAFEVPIINGDEVIVNDNNSFLIDNEIIINDNENNIVIEQPTINKELNIETNKTNELETPSKEILEEKNINK